VKNLVDDIIRYEQGLMEDEEVIEFFQMLIDTNRIYSLQGSYQRTAAYLIEDGHCVVRYEEEEYE
jgi:hypothetical protein